MIRRFVFLALLFLVATRQQPMCAAEKLPNVVVIVADDIGWRDYSFMGHPQIRTPNIDRLAAESLVFRRGYVPSSLCRPSLVSIISGLYSHQHKITSNDPPLPDGDRKGAEKNATFLAQRQEMINHIDAAPTLPRLLSQKGYVSFQTGKWWEGNYKRGGFTDGMTLGQRHGDAGLKIGRDTMEPMFEFMEKAQRDTKPFFVWYAPFLPHTPHNPPERLLARHKANAPTLQVAKYWAMCEWLDETCGQLSEFLDRKKLTDNTLVIYLADNGWIQDPNGNNYAPRSKQSPYEGGLRTPIMLKWPGRVTPKASEQLAISIDAAPTILTAVGLKPTAEMQGINLLDESATSKRKMIFGEIFTHNAVDVQQPASSLRYRWVVAEDWKLIMPTKANEPQAKIELFNVGKDPDEKLDLAAEHPQRVAELSKHLDAWWAGK